MYMVRRWNPFRRDGSLQGIECEDSSHHGRKENTRQRALSKVSPVDCSPSSRNEDTTDCSSCHTHESTTEDGCNRQSKDALAKENVLTSSGCSTPYEPALNIIRRGKVQFDSISIRECNRIVGDHPDLEIPLAIGWKYVDRPLMKVDEYEVARYARDLARGDQPGKCLSTPHTVHPLKDPKNVGKVLRRCTAFHENDHATSGGGCSKCLEPVSIGERIHLLQKVSGYRLSDINREERRRRMQIVMEWLYRRDPTDATIPCTVPNFEVFYTRYVQRQERIDPSAIRNT